MKKKRLAAVLTASVLMLAACGNTEAPEEASHTETESGEEANTEEADSQGESAEETALAENPLLEVKGPQYLKEITVSDYVTLGEYKGLEITLAEPEITEEYVESYIQFALANDPVSTPVTDRAAQLGDMANIDYEGKLDGVAFEGGTAQGYDLLLGSGTFIEGFEDGVVGMEIGETKDVEAVFPDPYKNNPDLAGKTAVFTVTLNAINQQDIPELTDEYVAGLGLEGCATVEEYRAYVSDMLYEQERTNYENQKSNLAIEAAVSASEFKEVPEGMAARMYNTMYNNIAMYAGMYGMDPGSYVAGVYGGAPEDYQQTLLTEAERMAEHYIMMQAIAEAEGVTVSDEEMEEELSKEAESAGYGSAEDYKEVIDAEAYREFLMTQKVIALITESAVVSAAE